VWISSRTHHKWRGWLNRLVRLRLCACRTTQSCFHQDRGHKRKSRRPAASSLRETHELPEHCAPALPSLAGLGKRSAARSLGARARTAPNAERLRKTTLVAVRANIAVVRECRGKMQWNAQDLGLRTQSRGSRYRNIVHVIRLLTRYHEALTINRLHFPDYFLPFRREKHSKTPNHVLRVKILHNKASPPE